MKHDTVEARAHSHGASKPQEVRKRKNGPVRTLTPNPLEWKLAGIMAGGHVGRLFTVSDGVIIANSNKRPKWLV